MKKNTPQEHLESNISARDALTEVLKKGAQDLLKQAVEMEMTEFLSFMRSSKQSFFDCLETYSG